MKYINRLFVAILLILAGLVAGIEVTLNGLSIGQPSLDLSDQFSAPEGFTFLSFQESSWYVNLPPAVYWAVAAVLILLAIYIYINGASGNKKDPQRHE